MGHVVTTPTPESVKALADGLTKAQASRLTSVAALRRQGLSWASRYGSLRANTSRATTSALVGMGLPVVNDGDCDTTVIGLAVAAHLGASHG